MPPRITLLIFSLLLLAACDTSKQTTSSNSLTNTQKEKPKMEGIDFIATGNEPSWKLTIDFDKGMEFTSMNAPNLIKTPVPSPVRPQDVAAISYRADTEFGTLHVTIFREKCADNMSGENFPYRVSVSTKTAKMKELQKFEGCGKYVGDGRLNDIWELEKINESIIEAGKMPKGAPYIELSIPEQKLSGLGGCNRIFGKVSMVNNQLKFGPVSGTKMACPALKTEQLFTTALSDQILSWSFVGEKLVLNGEKTRLVFHKRD